MILRILHAAELSESETRALMIRESAADTAAVDLVSEIISNVERGGADAVRAYNEKFDGVTRTDLVVSPEEFDRAESKLSDDLKRAFQAAANNIRAFHELQKQSLEGREARICGASLGYRYVPVRVAGVYVPGGKASYPSSVLMGVLPAIVAGVPEIVLITPPAPDGSVDEAVLYCARLAGAQRVLRAGGAHGIAAAALGVEVPQAQVIVGPGNRYVTAAKSLLAARGLIRMDLPAGPSEVVVIADETARAEFVAADMLSQAEHGHDSPAVLLTTSVDFARSVGEHIERGLQERPARREMKETSIRDHSFALVFEDLAQAFAFSNEYAPEHLEICTRDPRADLERITAAGSVFLGNYAPVALGDYFSGTNHVLPTGGAARFYSGLGVETFLKRITYQFPDRESLATALEPITLMSRHEGFEHEHGHSVAVRFEES